MDFQYKRNKVFNRGCVKLIADTIECPVHIDFLKPISLLLRRMAEDLESDEFTVIELPRVITPRALDEFLCAMYSVPYRCRDRDFDKAMDYKAVLDFFQVDAKFYADLDRNLSFGNHDRLAVLVKLEADRERFPLSFFKCKKLLVKSFVGTGFNCTMFIRREELLQLRPDTMLDLWYACTAAQNMIWMPESSLKSFKKRKIDAGDKKVRAEEMHRNFETHPWVPCFQVETLRNVDLILDVSRAGVTTTDVIIPEGPTVFLGRLASGGGITFYISVLCTEQEEWYMTEGKVGICGKLTVTGSDGNMVYEHTIDMWSVAMGTIEFVPEEYTARFIGSVRYIKN